MRPAASAGVAADSETPRSAAARHRELPGPGEPAAASRSRAWVSSGRSRTRLRNDSSSRLPTGTGSVRGTAPLSWSGVNPRAASTTAERVALGLGHQVGRHVRRERHANRRLEEGEGRLVGHTGMDRSVNACGCDSWAAVSRVAKSSPTRSANSRRATKPRRSADSRRANERRRPRRERAAPVPCPRAG